MCIYVGCGEYMIGYSWLQSMVEYSRTYSVKQADTIEMAKRTEASAALVEPMKTAPSALVAAKKRALSMVLEEEKDGFALAESAVCVERRTNTFKKLKDLLV